MRDIIRGKNIFNETRDIVGMLTDNESARVQAREANIFLESMKLTKNELLGVFQSGAGFLSAKHDRMTKEELRTRIVNECLLSFDIDIVELFK